MLSLGGANNPAMTSDAGTKTHSAVLSTGVWYFTVGRFVPSTSIDVYVNNNKESLTVGVGAAMTNTAHAFQIGTFASGTQLLNGRAALCFLCANALPDVILTGLFEQTRLLFGQ